MSIYACIPARGGSKRIPHKNVKDFLGRPLISYPIQVALTSGIFNDVIVSTDDPEIAEISEKYGAKVPFLRDKSLADDFTGTFPVTVDAFKKIQTIDPEIEAICCIYATAPLLTAEHLAHAYKDFTNNRCDCVMSVCEFSFPIQRAQIIDKNGYLNYREPEFAPRRSQDLQKCYQDCGLFYFYSKEAIEKNSVKTTRPFIMPRYRVIDIDTPEDWKMACAMAKAVNDLNYE
ncbi:MAG: pseudaminic acid cytidylyltransferase [Succinivibrio dextrinosolvens]|uniref:pseudaminic acid cytidylyltransferase n=1 Tax=Succinivibrio sp. TaxID=2053619 RepID=UPI0025E07FB7|nr:pseudaminic acid cytidylyltransferase [Succinivibrio sp.]MBQ9221445.1 pseudaminic acid cytidylyltransferase [Succinivibrio sp.]MDY6466191.1 pseudaminic acid cytidylyltransferase [Succinivibrio dextrinosolvens]